MELLAQGAEARVYVLSQFVGGRPAIVKERFAKSYRLPELDRKLTGKRVVGVSLGLGSSVDMMSVG
jgi:TP53 regulating kinase and related kinases